MRHQEFSRETQALLKSVHAEGFNISMLINTYRKRSRLSPEIPEEVVRAICLEYLKRKPANGFPYFLRVLKSQTEKYFAEQNIKQGQRDKNATWKVKIKLEM